MSALKPPHVVALDDVTQVAEEVIERLDTVVALQLHDEKLRDALQRNMHLLSDALERLCEQYRRGGELPAAGNVERAGLEAVALKAKSYFARQTGTPVVAESFVAELLTLRARIDDARKALHEGHSLRGALDEFDDRVLEIGNTIRDFL